MRISDWSSDVCSSDLPRRPRRSIRPSAVPPVEIIPGQRNRVLLPGELNLEHHQTHPPEADLASGQIELPHPAEPLNEDLARSFPIGHEPAAPLAPGVGLRPAQTLEVGDPQPRPLHNPREDTKTIMN